MLVETWNSEDSFENGDPKLFRLQVSLNMMMCNNQKKNQQHQRKKQSPKDQTRESHEALSKQIPVSP